jgi:hypothetical protein
MHVEREFLRLVQNGLLESLPSQVGQLEPVLQVMPSRGQQSTGRQPSPTLSYQKDHWMQELIHSVLTKNAVQDTHNAAAIDEAAAQVEEREEKLMIW